MKKKALIFGVTGQDGSYLAKFLLKKNYIVHGIKRRSSSLNTSRIDDIYQDINIKKKNFILHYGDITDTLSISKLVQDILPDEIYNLAAQSHVAVSFELPEYTANADALGSLRVLEAIKNIQKKKKIKYYQAGTSELFGKSQTKYQNEKTPFYPRSPYAAAKLYAHWITINYRESYKIFASNGILFNHESPYRGETFVTKKIISALVKISQGQRLIVNLGNIYSKRDWGHAKDYVEAMWKILQQKKPDDFVIATGKQFTVKEFINLVAKKLKMSISWKGFGLNEKCYFNNKIIIRINKKYFRPAEVDSLLGDASKSKKILKWQPTISITSLIDDMVNFELKGSSNL